MQPDILASVPRCGARTRAGTPCRSPAAHGRARCRMHGGARGSGAPRGNRNALKHGARSARMADIARYIRATSLILARARMAMYGPARAPATESPLLPSRLQEGSGMGLPQGMQERVPSGRVPTPISLPQAGGETSRDSPSISNTPSNPTNDPMHPEIGNRTGPTGAMEYIGRATARLRSSPRKPERARDFAGLSSSHLPRRRSGLICAPSAFNALAAADETRGGGGAWPFLPPPRGSRPPMVALAPDRISEYVRGSGQHRGQATGGPCR